MNPHDERRAARSEFLALIDRLVAEYAGIFPAGSVISCATYAREELLRQGVRAGLIDATESMARSWLARNIPAHV